MLKLQESEQLGQKRRKDGNQIHKKAYFSHMLSVSFITSQKKHQPKPTNQPKNTPTRWSPLLHFKQHPVPPPMEVTKQPLRWQNDIDVQNHKKQIFGGPFQPMKSISLLKKDDQLHLNHVWSNMILKCFHNFKLQLLFQEVLIQIHS